MAHLNLRGRRIGPIDGVLFDKDGTLSHSEPQLKILADARIAEAKRQFAAQGASGNDLNELEGLLVRTYGRNRDGVMPDGTLAVASRQHNILSTATVFAQMALGWAKALLLAEDVFDRVDAQWQDLHPDGHPVSLLPAASTMLRALKDAGVICAVISNDTTDGIQAFLKHHHLTDMFAAVWSADCLPCKPDPAAVHALCEQLNVPVERCALIGDADTDLLMAKRAGIAAAIGYVAGWHRCPDLTAHDYLIHHWQDLTVVPPSAQP